jgi:hypothetical protein
LPEFRSDLAVRLVRISTPSKPLHIPIKRGQIAAFVDEKPGFSGFFAYFCDNRENLDCGRMLLIMNML